MSARIATAGLAALLLLAAAPCGAFWRKPVARAEILGPSDIERLLEKAYDLLQAEQLGPAQELLEKILKAQPRHQQARLELAYLHIRKKEWKDALQLLVDALTFEPENLRARMELGYLRQTLGDDDAALDEFQLVARLPSEFQLQAHDAIKNIRELKAEQTPEARQDALMDQGYEALRKHDERLARERFRTALIEDPRRTEIYTQLGYMSLAEGKLDQAAKDFEGAHKLDARDYALALQLGYTYDSLHNDVKAEQAFRQALPSPDPKIHDAAADALKRYELARYRLYIDLYAEPYYTSRFDNRVGYAESMLGYKPWPDGPLSLYLAGRFTQDSQSNKGTEPQIYSDNVVMWGPGVRLQPRGFSTYLTAEAGFASNRTRTPDHPDPHETNYRVLLADYHEWPIPFLGPKTFFEENLSAGYYTRYLHNIIAALDLRAGYKLWDDGTSMAGIYAPFSAAIDRNKDYFNNFMEFGAGVEIQPYIKCNLRVRGEYRRGTYFGIEGRDPNTYGPHYDDFRILLIYAARFGLIK